MTEMSPSRAGASPIQRRWVVLIPVLLIGFAYLRQGHRHQLESSRIAGEEARAIEAAPIIGAMRAARIAQGFVVDNLVLRFWVDMGMGGSGEMIGVARVLSDQTR